MALAPLLSSVLDAVQPEAQRAGVSIERGCSDGTLLVEGDAAQLRDVFLNLAQNAIQAMPKGGRLTISCAPLPNRRVRVRVEDTGVGIAPENLAKIFELYYTTRERGTGIGLSLVYRTVQIHNGKIDVESTVGVGTTFIVDPCRARVRESTMIMMRPAPRRAARAADGVAECVRRQGTGAHRGRDAAARSAAAAAARRGGLYT